MDVWKVVPGHEAPRGDCVTASLRDRPVRVAPPPPHSPPPPHKTRDSSCGFNPRVMFSVFPWAFAPPARGAFYLISLISPFFLFAELCVRARDTSDKGWILIGSADFPAFLPAFDRTDSNVR